MKFLQYLLVVIIFIFCKDSPQNYSCSAETISQLTVKATDLNRLVVQLIY